MQKNITNRKNKAVGERWYKQLNHGGLTYSPLSISILGLYSWYGKSSSPFVLVYLLIYLFIYLFIYLLFIHSIICSLSSIFYLFLQSSMFFICNYLNQFIHSCTHLYVFIFIYSLFIYWLLVIYFIYHKVLFIHDGPYLSIHFWILI